MIAAKVDGSADPDHYPNPLHVRGLQVLFLVRFCLRRTPDRISPKVGCFATDKPFIEQINPAGVFEFVH